MITDDQIRERLAANICRLLSERGMSQVELSRKSHETAMSISRLCRGLHLVNAGTLVRVAEALEVDVSELVAQPTQLAQREKLAAVG